MHCKEHCPGGSRRNARGYATNSRSVRKLITSSGSPSSSPFGVSKYMGTRLKRRSASKLRNAFQPELAAADVFVPIDARALLLLAVVEVNRLDPLDADVRCRIPSTSPCIPSDRPADTRPQTRGTYRSTPPAGRYPSPSPEIAASCSNRQPRFEPCPAVFSSKIWLVTFGARLMNFVDRCRNAGDPFFFASSSYTTRDASRHTESPVAPPAPVPLPSPRSTAPTNRRPAIPS